MSKNSEFPVRGTIPDATFNQLLQTKTVDIEDKQIKIGDKIAYNQTTRYVYFVGIGEVIDISLYWAKQWNNTLNRVEPDMKIENIKIECKIKQSNGPKIIRLAKQIVKI